jgi:hypothetical protein
VRDNARLSERSGQLPVSSHLMAAYSCGKPLKSPLVIRGAGEQMSSTLQRKRVVAPQLAPDLDAVRGVPSRKTEPQYKPRRWVLQFPLPLILIVL